jgi:hypothetical protein
VSNRLSCAIVFVSVMTLIGWPLRAVAGPEGVYATLSLGTFNADREFRRHEGGWTRIVDTRGALAEVSSGVAGVPALGDAVSYGVAPDLGGDG